MPYKQVSKESARYRAGTTTKRCGTCKHFEVLHRNGCERVKGFIRAAALCDYYARKGQPDVESD